MVRTHGKSCRRLVGRGAESARGESLHPRMVRQTSQGMIFWYSRLQRAAEVECVCDGRDGTKLWQCDESVSCPPLPSCPKLYDLGDLILKATKCDFDGACAVPIQEFKTETEVCTIVPHTCTCGESLEENERVLICSPTDPEQDETHFCNPIVSN